MKYNTNPLVFLTAFMVSNSLNLATMACSLFLNVCLSHCVVQASYDLWISELLPILKIHNLIGFFFYRTKLCPSHFLLNSDGKPTTELILLIETYWLELGRASH